VSGDRRPANHLSPLTFHFLPLSPHGCPIPSEIVSEKMKRPKPEEAKELLNKKKRNPRNKAWPSLDQAGKRAPAARQIRACDDPMSTFFFICESVSDVIQRAVCRMSPAVTRNQISIRPFESLVSRLESDSSQSREVIGVF
jgi:hypothetical protein